MILTTFLRALRAFFCRSDVRIVIFGTITDGVVQILSKRYLKNHPELLKLVRRNNGNQLYWMFNRYMH